MSIVLHLSALAVRQLLDGARVAVGLEAGVEAVARFLGERLGDQSARLTTALERANASAWRALEVALAGESWWQRVQAALGRRDDQAFREQVQAFLKTAPLPEGDAEFRRKCAEQLRAARQRGLLTGSLDAAALARRAGEFARFHDPQALLDAEWAAIDLMADLLREARLPDLAHLLTLRPVPGVPLLVVAVRYFFRRQVETDAQLFRGLAFARLERLNQEQEASFAGLEEALAAHADRLEELLAGAAADMQDVKALLERQGRQLEAVGRAVVQATTQPPGPAGTPQKEQNLRLEMLNALLTTPHRRLEGVWPVHEALIAKDPRFYVRLAAWYFDKGEVRDHKEVFVVALCLSGFPGHRDVGLALLRRLPPYQVARVVDFIHGRVETRPRFTTRTVSEVQVETKPGRKRGGRRRRAEGKKVRRVVTRREVERADEVVGRWGLFRNLPGSLRTEVARYLREREADPDWFDSTVLVARRALKRLYTLLHIKPGERAQQILFDDRPPADSRVGALKRLARLTSPEEQARALAESRVPFRVAVSVLPKTTPAVLEALIGRMSPQEIVNNLAVLGRHGALTDPDLKALIELKLEEARGDDRVSTLKAEQAARAVDLPEEVRRRLAEATDARIKARGRLRRPTALLVDKSGSMELAIEIGKRVAALLAAACERELYVYAFDTMAYPITAAGTDWAAWLAAFAGIEAGGETSCGVALEVMRRRQQAVEQIVVVTDEEEYDPPFFVESFLKYRQALGVEPAVCFVRVPDSSRRLEEQCKLAGIVAATFDFNGDYYSLPNLLPLLEPPSPLDLLMEVLEYPLPERRPT